MKKKAKHRSRGRSPNGVERIANQALAHIEYLLGLCGFSQSEIASFRHSEVLPKLTGSPPKRFKGSTPHFFACAQVILKELQRCRRAWRSKRWSSFGDAALELGMARGDAFVSATAAWDRRKGGRRRVSLDVAKTNYFVEVAMKLAVDRSPPIRKKEIYYDTMEIVREAGHISYTTFTEHFPPPGDPWSGGGRK